MSDDQAGDPKGPFKDTLDYVPRAEAVPEESIYGEAVEEVVGGGRRGGGSSVAPWLIGGGIGCLLVVLMCAGVITFGVYKARQFVQEMAVDDPVAVRERTDDLVGIDIPDSFEPKLAMQLPESIGLGEDGDPFRLVIYSRADGDGFLAIGYVGDEVDDPDEQLAGLKQMITESGESHESIEISDEQTREMTIRGEDAQFTFSRGTVEPSGEEFRQVIGHFEGKRRQKWLFFQVEQNAYDEAEIDAIIDSIE